MARYKICIEAQTFLACEARESLIGFVQLFGVVVVNGDASCISALWLFVWQLD
jgi:hypothetical protein